MNQQRENQKKLAKGEKEEDGRGFMLTRNAYLYPPRTHTRIHHVLPFVITSIVHPYLPSSLTRIKFTLSPASTSLSHSSCSLKRRLTERGNDAWQNIEKMEGGKMKIRKREQKSASPLYWQTLSIGSVTASCDSIPQSHVTLCQRLSWLYDRASFEGLTKKEAGKRQRGVVGIRKFKG